MTGLKEVNSLQALSVGQMSNQADKGISDKKMDFGVVMNSVDASSSKGTKIAEVKVTVNDNGSWKTAAANSKAVVSNDNNAWLTTEQTAQMETVATTIQEEVQKLLDIDEKTLEAVMTQLGLVWTDLLQPQNLQQLVLAVNGIQDASVMLTNESLLEQFQLLSDELNVLQTENMQPLEIAVDSENVVMQDADASMELSVMTENAQQTDGSEKIIPEAVEETNVSNQVATATSQDEPTAKQTEVQISVENTATGTDTQTVVLASQTDGETDGQSESEELEQFFAQQKSDVQPEVLQNGTAFTQMVAEDLTQVQTEQMHVQTTTILDQIVEQIHIVNDLLDTTVEMQLNPESLGKVLLTVSMKEGMMTANFTVQTEETRMAIESQMYQLRESLEQKELKVDAVEVTVSDFSFTQTGQDQADHKNMEQGDGKSRRFRFDSEESEEDIVSADAEAERVRRSVMRDNGSSIDFTA